MLPIDRIYVTNLHASPVVVGWYEAERYGEWRVVHSILNPQPRIGFHVFHIVDLGCAGRY